MGEKIVSGFLSSVYETVAASRGDWEALNTARNQLNLLIEDVKAFQKILAQTKIPYEIVISPRLETENPSVDFALRENNQSRNSKYVAYNSRSKSFTLMDRSINSDDKFSIQEVGKMQEKLGVLFVKDMDLSLDQKFKIIKAFDELKIKDVKSDEVLIVQKPTVAEAIITEPAGFANAVARLKGHTPL